jgi:hypothetical protein
MKWSEVDVSLVEMNVIRERVKFTYAGAPFKFQIPRGLCLYGANAYKSLTVDMGAATDFVKWWAELEARLCTLEPFRSNMVNGGLRVKLDDRTNIFNQSKEIKFPSIEEGLFRNNEVSCQIEVDGRYFFNDCHGLVVKCTQLMFFGDLGAPPPTSGECCFLDD